MMGRADFRTELCEARRVRAVLAADDEHDIDVFGELLRGFLPLVGRRADCAENPHIAGFFEEHADDGLEPFPGERRLRDDAEPWETSKLFRFLLGLDDVRVAARPFANALDFRVALLADDDDVVSLLCEFVR